MADLSDGEEVTKESAWRLRIGAACEEEWSAWEKQATKRL